MERQWLLQIFTVAVIQSLLAINSTNPIQMHTCISWIVYLFMYECMFIYCNLKLNQLLLLLFLLLKVNPSYVHLHFYSSRVSSSSSSFREHCLNRVGTSLDDTDTIRQIRNAILLPTSIIPVYSIHTFFRTRRRRATNHPTHTPSQPAIHPWLYRLVWSSLNFPSPNSICQLRAHWMVLCLLCPTTRNNHIASDNSAPGRQPASNQPVSALYIPGHHQRMGKNLTDLSWRLPLLWCFYSVRSLTVTVTNQPTSQPLCR